MPLKTFELETIGQFTVVKNKTNRNIRLSLSPEGDIRISIPYWAPYKTGIDFADSKSDWILKNSKKPNPIINGQAIGKMHVIYFIPSLSGADTIRTRVNNGKIIINYPRNLDISEKTVQAKAKSAAIRALKLEAEAILTERLTELAHLYDLRISRLRIKKLQSRWGSCDTKHVITLNLYLVQLPYDLIDYVILHELAHTKHLNHSQNFWTFLEEISPEAKKLRKRLKTFRAGVIYNAIELASI